MLLKIAGIRAPYTIILLNEECYCLQGNAKINEATDPNKKSRDYLQQHHSGDNAPICLLLKWFYQSRARYVVYKFVDSKWMVDDVNVGRQIIEP